MNILKMEATGSCYITSQKIVRHGYMAYVAGRAFVLPSPIYHPGVRVAQVACGNEHCLLLTETGQVFSWGTGRYEGVL
jgi:alpha-tubulin suppressor-like RCC1 family protein